MAQRVKLSNPPITEALIDIRVKLSNEFDIEIFDDLNKNHLIDYPIKEKQNEYFTDVKLENNKKPLLSKMSEGLRGFFYKSEDKKMIVQFRRDGFTFNQLPPYDDWESLTNKAKKCWEIYSEISRPIKITRLATRFINHIKLPLPIYDFAEYMTSPPQNPYNNDPINGYLNRIQLVDIQNEISSNITQTLEKGTEKGEITLLLDIDTYIRKDISPHDVVIWDHFKKLQIKKNDIFFSSLTEKTINLHK